MIKYIRAITDSYPKYPIDKNQIYPWLVDLHLRLNRALRTVQTMIVLLGVMLALKWYLLISKYPGVWTAQIVFWVIGLTFGVCMWRAYNLKKLWWESARRWEESDSPFAMWLRTLREEQAGVVQEQSEEDYPY